MRRVWVLLTCVLLGTTLGFGDSLTFNDPSGTHNASATFTVSGDVLTIVLTNNGPAATSPADVLTALLWTSTRTFTPDQVTAYGGLIGSNLLVSPCLGCEWDYASGFAGPSSSNQGVSAAGLGLFGHGDFSCASDCANIGGADYGLVTGLNATGKGLSQNSPYVKNSITLTLTGAQGFQLTDLSNVTFIFGTSLSENQVPEPGTLTFLGLGLLAAGLASRRKKKA